jgi:hypothetical protein
MNRFFTSVKNLLKFTDEDIHPIIESVSKLIPSERDICFLAIYYRAYADLRTLMLLKGVPDFQTVSRIARAMLEYAIDLRLINCVPNAIPKMATFVEVEKLRGARRAMEFLNKHPEIQLNISIFSDFVANNEAIITKNKKSLWPGAKSLEHWSEMKMDARCRKLGAPFEQWYEIDFRRLSWYTHTGLAGVVNIQGEAFKNILTSSLIIIMDTYCEVLACVIKEFKIDHATSKINNLMKYAKQVSFTDSPKEAQMLYDGLVGKPRKQS